MCDNMQFIVQIYMEGCLVMTFTDTCYLDIVTENLDTVFAINNH